MRHRTSKATQPPNDDILHAPSRLSHQPAPLVSTTDSTPPQPLSRASKPPAGRQLTDRGLCGRIAVDEGVCPLPDGFEPEHVAAVPQAQQEDTAPQPSPQPGANGRPNEEAERQPQQQDDQDAGP